MGKFYFSAIAVLAIMAGAAAARPMFVPGEEICLANDVTICEVSVQMGRDCAIVVEAIRRSQRILIEPTSSIKDRKIRLPTDAEMDSVENSAPSVSDPAPKAAVKKAPKALKKKQRVWTKNFATLEQRQMWFMEDYVLKAGENIFSVARKYRNAHWKSPQVLVWFNGLQNPRKLGAGQMIAIPDTNHFYWLELNTAPYGNRPLMDPVVESGFSDSVQMELLKMIEEGNHYEDWYVNNGQVFKMMASAPLNENGRRKFDVKRDVVVCLKDGQVLHGRALQVVEGDSICIAFIPDYCNNFSTYKIPVPSPEPPPVVYTPPPDELPPPCTDCPPCDTPVVEEPPPDRGVEPPLDTSPIFNRNMLQLWGGRYFPWPYVGDGHNFLGGRLALFLPAEDGESFAFGMDVGVNSWMGYGPRPERFRYAGLRPSGGLVFDWLAEKSRFDIFLNYAVQLDWGWDGSYVDSSKQYHSRQLTQLVNPSLAWVGALNPGWSRWWGWWLDGGYDLGNAESRMDHKISDVGGVSRTRSQDPPTDKSYVCGGLYVFYWDISTKKTSLVLGSGVKSLHLWEDNRYEVEVDELLDINHFFQLGVGYKYTWNSVYDRQNGPSLVAYFNLSVWDIGKYKHNKQ